MQEENEKLRQDWRLDCLKCEYKNTKADVDKYKQALEEIREVLMACLEFKTCVKCKFQEKCKWDVEEFILTTINEALNDRD